MKKKWNSVCVKDIQNIFITLKNRLVLSVFRIEEERDNDTETSLKEGEVI